MPYSLVHLAVALEAHRPDEPTPLFLLGSLAPDAVRAPQETYRLLKGRTHMLDAGAGWPEPLREWVRAQRAAAAAPTDLVRGYAAHLLTDRLWRDTVVAELRHAVPVETTWPDFVRLYYGEMDLVEGALYRALPRRAWVEALLADAPASAVPGMVTADDLDWWRRRTLAQWPEFAERANSAQPVYASAARVMAFVPEAASLVGTARREWPEW